MNNKRVAQGVALSLGRAADNVHEIVNRGSVNRQKPIAADMRAVANLCETLAPVAMR